MYTDLQASLARTKERSGATSADDSYLTELLILSAGVDASGVTHQRIFYVAAKFLEQNRAGQALSEADGAKFTGLAKPIASLLNMQAAYDIANQLIVPKGFEAGAGAASQSARFGSGSIAPTLNP